MYTHRDFVLKSLFLSSIVLSSSLTPVVANQGVQQRADQISLNNNDIIINSNVIDNIQNGIQKNKYLFSYEINNFYNSLMNGSEINNEELIKLQNVIYKSEI